MNCPIKNKYPHARRKCLGWAWVGSLCALGIPEGVWGAAREVELSDALRGVLGQRWRETTTDVSWPLTALVWQDQVQSRLGRWIPELSLRSELSRHLWYEARRAGLSLSLVLGLIEVESGFRKHAISAAGAVGYMQIMPFWARHIGDGDVGALLRTQPNLRYGCLILRHYLDVERGNLAAALRRYNGTLGVSDYPNRVLAAAQFWRTSHD
ncbi:MAG: lytic transglycosylase domain-containing protein [Alphaproteobacteria bacterium]|nr:lytic transglycosylase domain-containing protein [Alphaproteobacteria bacterium]